MAAKRYYKVVNPFDTIHAQKKNQIGEFIGEMDDQIGLRFEDGKEFYFWPDEVEMVDELEITLLDETEFFDVFNDIRD